MTTPSHYRVSKRARELSGLEGEEHRAPRTWHGGSSLLFLAPDARRSVLRQPRQRVLQLRTPASGIMPAVVFVQTDVVTGRRQRGGQTEPCLSNNAKARWGDGEAGMGWGLGSVLGCGLPEWEREAGNDECGVTPERLSDKRDRVIKASGDVDFADPFFQDSGKERGRDGSQ